MSKMTNLFSQDEAQTVRLKRLKKQPWRTFYSTFVPKAQRKLAQKQANDLQKKHVAQLWNLFLKDYFNGELEYFQLKPKKQFSDQNIIWQYWGQGFAAAQQNQTVKLCFASVDRFKGDYQVIRLDDENIKDYLDLPDFVWEKKKNPVFKPAFFADLIRLALLDVYGGVWIDATILLTAPIDSEILQQDFFMFHRVDTTENKEFWINFNADYFAWHDEHYINVLNSFIVGKKDNQSIHICLDIMLNYWKTQTAIPHYFFFQIMFDVVSHYDAIENNMLSRDDTLPHLLQIRMNELFQLEDYQQITQTIGIHKLNYIQTVVKGSFYEYLLKQYGIG